ncbi:MAG: hypothetical protein F2806_03635 [Actinobacteria bacterium]|uniref:Unannotated protein n=1 Tax=freshwater metagenome TaxID=449393 RepID=A0A6J7FSV1_9ZZZZ|nr:hypothetical protein [Actinomycetota bacterium]
MKSTKHSARVVGALIALTSASMAASVMTDSVMAAPEPPTIAALFKADVVVGADMWDTVPRIMSLTLNFTDIIGVPGADSKDQSTAKAAVVAAGGAWSNIRAEACSTKPTQISHTTAVSPEQYYGVTGLAGVHNTDVVQVQMSWPVLPSSMNPTDFKITLNNGTVAPAISATVMPNFEYNERSVLILNGEFGNRLPKSDPAARYPAKVEIVADATPMMLVGPGGRLASAVGLTMTNDKTPYDTQSANPELWTGPRVIAAKITRMSTLGEGGPKPVSKNLLPNDGVAMFGKKAAQFRVRMLTVGGALSPNGVRGLYPTDYRNYFRLVARDSKGRLIPLVEAGRTYSIDGNSITVVGLADLGKKQKTYDECYQEDSENQIDIILSGSAVAAQRIAILEIPADGGGYLPLYNDGGPGNSPTPGVVYTAKSPRHSANIINGLVDPMRTTFNTARMTGSS